MPKQQDKPEERKLMSPCCQVEMKFNGSVFYCPKCRKVNINAFRLALGGKTTIAAVRDAEARARKQKVF